MLRSGTAIGALVMEAEQAESKPDFIHKLSISLKEANESEYWIELLFRSNYIEQTEYSYILSELKQILKILTAIIKTSKKIR